MLKGRASVGGFIDRMECCADVSLVVTGRDERRGQEVVERIREAGGSAHVIAPHLVRTAGIEGNEQAAGMLSACRGVSPAEVAAAAVYLASSEANFVHGITLLSNLSRIAQSSRA